MTKPMNVADEEYDDLTVIKMENNESYSRTIRRLIDSYRDRNVRINTLFHDLELLNLEIHQGRPACPNLVMQMRDSYKKANKSYKHCTELSRVLYEYLLMDIEADG